MALTVTHTYVSPILDAGNPDLVGPDEWNAAHTVTGSIDANPAGSDRQIQFNDAGVMGADSGLVYTNDGNGSIYAIDNSTSQVYHYNEIASLGTAGGVYVADIYNAGAAKNLGYLRFRIDDASGGSEDVSLRMGLVGAGTSRERLRISSDGYANLGAVTSNVNIDGNSFVQVVTDGSWSFAEVCPINTGGGGGIAFAKTRSGSANDRTVPVQIGDTIGGIYYSGADGSSNYFISGGQSYEVDAAVSAGVVPLAYVINTGNGTPAYGTERFRIDSNGFSTFGGFATTSVDGASGIIQGVGDSNVGWQLSAIAIGNHQFGAGLNFAKTRATSPAVSTAVQNGDNIAGVWVAGSDGVNSNFNKPSAGFSFDVDNTVSTNSIPVGLTFNTGAWDYGSTRLNINSNGKFTAFVGSSTFEIFSDDAGVFGPILNFRHASASPAAFDQIAAIAFNGRDSGANDTLYASISVLPISVTNGSEAAAIGFNVMNGSGALTNYVAIDNVALYPPTAGYLCGRDGASWASVGIASGGSIRFADGDITIRHATNLLFFEGADFGYAFASHLLPTVNDIGALGSSGLSWADLFLADGGTINWNNGVLVATQTTGTLAFTGTTGATLTVTRSLAANTSGDGLALINSTASTSGSQEYSPRLRLTGQGWKTLATAASQSVDWIIENTPVQAVTNPMPYLSIKSQRNGGGYSESLSLTNNPDNGGGIMTFTAPGGGGTQIQLSVLATNPLAMFYVDGGVGVRVGSMNTNPATLIVNSNDIVKVTATAMSPSTNDAVTLGTTALMWSDLFLADGGVLNWNNGNVVVTHSTNTLTFTAVTSLNIVHTAGTAGILSIGQTGATNPAFQVNCGTGGGNGIQLRPSAGGGRMLIVTLSTSTNEGLDISSKATGTLRLNTSATNGAVEFGQSAVPLANDGAALGTTALKWSDLFLADGAVINFNNGDVLLTHSTNVLAATGATNYSFDNTVLPSANDAAALGTATVSWSDLFLASGAVINFNNGNLTLTHSATNLTVAGGSLTLAAGTATAAPLVFTAGSNLTTAVDGAMEFDGQMLYFSPDGTDRRIVASSAYIRQHAAYVLSNSTTNQKLFNSSTNGQVLLPTGTYRFNCMFSISGMSATSGNAAFSVAAGSGATVTNGMMYWTAIDSTTTPTAGAAFQSGMVRSVTGPTNLATASTLTEMQAWVTGTFEVSVAGQVIPSIALVTGITATNNIGSFFECWKLGATTDTNIGKWS